MCFVSCFHCTSSVFNILVQITNPPNRNGDADMTNIKISCAPLLHVDTNNSILFVPPPTGLSYILHRFILNRLNGDTWDKRRRLHVHRQPFVNVFNVFSEDVSVERAS